MIYILIDAKNIDLYNYNKSNLYIKINLHNNLYINL